MSKEEVLIKFGKKIRNARMSKGLSQEQLAFKAELHRTYIGMVERGERNISLQNIHKIAKALDMEIFQLFSYGSEDPR